MLYNQSMAPFLRFINRWMYALLMMALIFMFSSIPSEEMPHFSYADFIVKKGAHMVVFGLLALAFWRGFQWNPKWIWLAWLMTFLYAILDEFHQSFVPGRHAWWVDVAIDSFSAALVLTFTAWWRRRKNRSG